ncbi:MAG: HK97-gp10 family putative phage morphogenesis protein [Clostridium sp.]
MSLDVDGFDDLFDTLNSLGQVGKKASKKAVKDGLSEILVDLKAGAPRDTGEGADALSLQYIKTNKNGAAWGASGIGKDNWEKTKGLWFQNYGYENMKNVGWITKIFQKSKSKAEKIMIKTLSDEIDKALK